MDSKSVTLMIRFKDVTGTWKRRPAARGANGRVKGGHALIDGRVVKVSDWTYDLRFTVNRKTVYRPVGDSAAMAEAERVRFEIQSSVKAQAREAGIQVVESVGSKSLKAAATAYIDNALKRGASEAAEQAKLVTGEFMKLVRCVKVDEVTQDDIFAYHAWLRKNQCGDRTVANKHARLASWLRFGGIDPKQIPQRPRFEKTMPTRYTSEQIRSLLNAAKPYQKIMILLALKAGLRDQELQHVEFRDINGADKTIRVRAKPQWGFMTKVWEQRDAPIPTDLVEDLRKWQDQRSGHTLILDTRNKTPNDKMLRSLKRLAYRAGLNCGMCDPCQERNECQEFTLHKFRRTCITKWLQGTSGDLRTVQSWAGHKDITSTMRYLVPESASESQAKVDAIKW
jgi:integrase